MEWKASSSLGLSPLSDRLIVQILQHSTNCDILAFPVLQHQGYPYCSALPSEIPHFDTPVSILHLT